MKFDQAELEKMVDDVETASEQVRAFVAQVEAENETLFVASEKQIEAYYNGITDRKQLVKHFIGRMVNERMNMVELAGKVANASPDMDPKELQLLSKQALDEANHFRMVRDVVEYISGEPVDLNSTVTRELSDTFVKGAKLLTKYDCENDPIALALYQAIVEGHASRNWQMMADCLKDPFLANTYGKIAADERFHSIGTARNSLTASNAQSSP